MEVYSSGNRPSISCDIQHGMFCWHSFNYPTSSVILRQKDSNRPDYVKTLQKIVIIIKLVKLNEGVRIQKIKKIIL